MKHWLYRSYGDPTQLIQEEAAEPIPKVGEISVRAKCLSINPIDFKLLGGKLRFVIPVKFPAIPCFDLAGLVENDNGVAGFKKGDKVFVRIKGLPGGAAREVATMDASVVAKMPEGLGFAGAAAIPLAGMTALQGLRDQGGMKAGSRVLIVGASGGVGHYGVQIAIAAGAHVTAVCGTRNVEMVKTLGAHEIIDYRAQDSFKSADGKPYDIVFDCIGQTPFRFGERFEPVMTKDSVYVTPAPSGEMMRYKFLNFWRKPRLKAFFLKPSRADLEYLASLYSAGKLRSVIDSTFAFKDLPKAFERALSGRAAGKIVVNVAESA